MADVIGASEAMASAARGILRSENSEVRANDAFVVFIARGLSAPMRAALRELQFDMFGRGSLSSGHPHVVTALRRRGIIGNRDCVVTDLGELVIAAAGLDGAEVGHA